MTNQQIAQNILDQLGGNAFCVMTNAKNLVHGDDDSGSFLQFQIMGGKWLKVTLTQDDEYQIDMMRFRNLEMKTLKSAKVEVGQLRETFTSMTGLHTSL